MTLLAIDGNSILNRAFYGIKLLSTKDGRFTNAIYGFLAILSKLKDSYSPDGTAIAFDMKKPTFRHNAYDGYKANRKGMPPELAQQFPVLKELLQALGYTLVECEGFEADDILGTLASVCEEKGENCIIATGDRDSLQLVSDSIFVSLAVTKGGHPETTLYDKEKIAEEYGVSPRELIEIKALQGDTSDNIPGVAGIGKKGAADLIQKYKSIEYIYENIDSLDIKDGLRKKLIDGKESAYMSRMLGEICKDAPIDRDISRFCILNPDLEKAAKMMTELELFSIMKKLDIKPCEIKSTENTSDNKTVTYGFVDTDKFPEEIKNAYFITHLKDDNIESIFLNHNDTVYKIIPNDSELKRFFEDDKIKKYTIDTKPLYRLLENKAVKATCMESDAVLAAYLLKPSAKNYDLPTLCAEYGVKYPEIKDCPENDLENAKICAAFKELTNILLKETELAGEKELLEEIEMPLSLVLAEMENEGFCVDTDGIKSYGEELSVKIDEIQKSIYELVGYEFNINSPKQLGEALFVKLGLPSGKKTKSGYSTSADVLENLRYSHPVIEPVLEYRALCKLKSTYCDGLLKVVASDGRIHSCFNQTETRTGRISSTEPNLQNIPVRTEQGKQLRRFFKARDGYVLVDADYSQIELRVLAHIADDKNMISAFLSGEDIHAITASQVFGVPLSMVTSQMRSRAKAVNFGIVYGIGAFSLSKDIGVTRKEADEYIKSYLRHYDGVDRYMNRVAEKAKEDGYVSTMFSRRRYLPELKSSNFVTRSFGERVARNMPIQGTAADIIKIAMIKVSNRLKEENLKARLILQVHDELIAEAPESECEAVKAILQQEMENAVKLNVPLIAEASTGKTWFDAKA